MWASWIWGLLVAMVGPLVKHVLVALGVGFVTYQGLDLVLTQLQGYVFAEFAGMPANMVAIVGLLRVDEAVNIIFSAIAFRAVIVGFNGGFRRNTVWNKPGPFQA